MKQRNMLLAVLLIVALAARGDNWLVIKNSNLYYYGEGTGPTAAEAEQAAVAEMVKMMATDLGPDFRLLDDDGGAAHADLVRKCLQTYMPSPLVKEGAGGQAGMACRYMLRSDAEKLFAPRISRLLGMVAYADRAMEMRSVDVALQYYYWAYALLRSLPGQENLKDSRGKVLARRLPETIKEVVDGIKVSCVGREGSELCMRFTYKGKPVSVDFTYYDGRNDGCEGHADGGNAYIETAEDYDGADGYRVKLEYEYRRWARGDDEMKRVLAAVPRLEFAQPMDLGRTSGLKSIVGTKPAVVKNAGKKLPDAAAYAERIKAVVEAMRAQEWDKTYAYFSARGFRVNKFIDLVAKRNGRVLGDPTLTLYPAADGNVLVRGLKMAFSVTERGRKTTLVDDVIFTFDRNLKISNLTFGIGSVAENDLMLKNFTLEDTLRQVVMDFLENYKTAYCLKDSNYIEAIFDDNATIVTGSVARRTMRPGIPENQLRRLSGEEIRYRRYTKRQYLESLKRTFDRNQFINIKFTHNDVMLLEKMKPRQVFQIQIGQEYNSSTYADQGYLFLLVDITDKSQPLIKIRGWQPKPDPDFGLFTAGYFLK